MPQLLKRSHQWEFQSRTTLFPTIPLMRDCLYLLGESLLLMISQSLKKILTPVKGLLLSVDHLLRVAQTSENKKNLLAVPKFKCKEKKMIIINWKVIVSLKILSLKSLTLEMASKFKDHWVSQAWAEELQQWLDSKQRSNKG